MDRFIDTRLEYHSLDTETLKSNMDRFIDLFLTGSKSEELL